MNDLEMTELCALAMGWKHLGAVGVEPPKPGEPDKMGLWCLSGANDWWVNPEGFNVCAPCSGIPDPLHDDAQAMALVKRFGLVIEPESAADQWAATWINRSRERGRKSVAVRYAATLNRAIVECVANKERQKIYSPVQPPKCPPNA